MALPPDAVRRPAPFAPARPSAPLGPVGVGGVGQVGVGDVGTTAVAAGAGVGALLVEGLLIALPLVGAWYLYESATGKR